MFRRNIADLELGSHPAIALALDDSYGRDAIVEQLDAGVDLVELRVDLFSSQDADDVVKHFAGLDGIPRLATARAAREGGRWQLGEPEREALYDALLPVTDAIDCELESEFCGGLFGRAREAQVLSIGSYHDFKKCPREQKLRELADRSLDLGADVLKVAALCETNDDLRLLAQFTLEQADRGVIVIGMGTAGQTSRIFFPALGSMVMYTFLGEPTAPGQLNCADTILYRSRFYG